MSDTVTPPLARQMAHMLRERNHISAREFGSELAGLFKVMFPNADDHAHEEMELVGQALACWLQLFVKSELERIRDGYH